MATPSDSRLDRLLSELRDATRARQRLEHVHAASDPRGSEGAAGGGGGGSGGGTSVGTAMPVLLRSPSLGPSTQRRRRRVFERDEQGMVLFSRERLQIGAIANVRGVRFPITSVEPFKPRISGLPRNVPYLFELHALSIAANSVRAVQDEEVVANEHGFDTASAMRNDLAVTACYDPLRACRQASLLTNIGHADCDVIDLLKDLCTVWPSDDDSDEIGGRPAADRSEALALEMLVATDFACPVTRERILIPVSCPSHPSKVLSLRGMLRKTLGVRLSSLCAADARSMATARRRVKIDPLNLSDGDHFLDLRLNMPAVRALVRMRCSDVHASESNQHFRKLMVAWMLRSSEVASVPSAWRRRLARPYRMTLGGCLLRPDGLTASEVWCRDVATLDRWCKRSRVRIATTHTDLDWTDPEVVLAVRGGAVLLGPKVRVTTWCGDSLQLHFPEDEKRTLDALRILEEAVERCKAKLTGLKTIIL